MEIKPMEMWNLEFKYILKIYFSSSITFLFFYRQMLVVNILQKKILVAEEKS